MSLFISDDHTDYVSVSSHDSGDMVELYTAGTAPPSSTYGSIRSGSTFVTALDALANFNNVDTDYTFVTAFDQANDTEASALANEHYSPPRPIHLGTFDEHNGLYSAVHSPEQPVASEGLGEVANTPMDPSTASIRSMIERVENSVGAILSGVNALTTARDGSRVATHSGRTPRPRAAKMTSLTRKIREELKKLLGENFMEDVVPRDALKAFGELWGSQTDVTLQPACCDIEDFRVDLLGSPRSAWNQSASRIFSAHFIRTHSPPANEQHLVQYFFFQRMKCLQATYRKESANNAARKAARTAKRRHQRRQALFTKRMDVALDNPLLEDHIPILRQLGASGMSSDESDVEDQASGQVTRYLVHKPVWRAESLSAWLRVFDSLHILSRKLSAAGTRGSFPRLRVESDIVSTRGFVSGLPSTAYDAQWLERHIAASFNVGQTLEEYSFTHDNQIFSYLRYRRI